MHVDPVPSSEMQMPSPVQGKVRQPVLLAEQQPLWQTESLPTDDWHTDEDEQAKCEAQLLLGCTQQPAMQA